jgi:hypothetical protein
MILWEPRGISPRTRAYATRLPVGLIQVETYRKIYRMLCRVIYLEWSGENE